MVQAHVFSHKCSNAACAIHEALLIEITLLLCPLPRIGEFASARTSCRQRTGELVSATAGDMAVVLSHNPTGAAEYSHWSICCSWDWLQMVDPLVGEQAVPTVMALVVLAQPAPPLLGERKFLPYLC